MWLTTKENYFLKVGGECWQFKGIGLILHEVHDRYTKFFYWKTKCCELYQDSRFQKMANIAKFYYKIIKKLLLWMSEL